MVRLASGSAADAPIQTTQGQVSPDSLSSPGGCLTPWKQSGGSVLEEMEETLQASRMGTSQPDASLTCKIWKKLVFVCAQSSVEDVLFSF